jgi:16S rRNA (guanine966-N2)-methyltransferase
MQINQSTSQHFPLPTTKHHTRSLSNSLITMKRPNRRRRSPEVDPTTINTADLAQELPANLKRHVTAKRPTLGHVVPKNSQSRKFRPDEGGSGSSQLRAQGQARDSQRYNNPSNLRILGGSCRGRKLESPTVYLRPMMGKVKEAVYSTFTSFGLYDDVIAGSIPCRTRHLDIFSGSGSVGLESLSRGVRHCTFVDMAEDCCSTCERNIEKCGFDGWNEGGIGSGIGEEGESVAKVVCADAFRALRQPETVGIDPNAKYDLVTLCPPYEEIVYADLISAVANSVLVTEDTVILIEYPVELGCLPHAIAREDGGVLVGVRNRKYGRTVIAMYIVNPTGAREDCQSRPEEFISLGK